MNSHFQAKPEHKQTQEIQSFYEPALCLLGEMHEIKKGNLKRRGHPEHNAAVTKVELSQEIANRFRITLWLSQQIISSLINADLVETFSGHVRPKVGKK